MTGAKDTSEPAPPIQSGDSAGAQLVRTRTRLRDLGDAVTTPARPAVEDDGADVPEDTQDHWLDEVSSEEEESHRSLVSRATGTFTVPVLWLRRIFSYIATTPGKLLTVTLVLSVAIFAAGYSMSQSSATRQTALDVLLTSTEPMSYAAHNLYTSLSLADTIATTGFVQAGVESAGTRARYNAAVDRASVAASETAAGMTMDDDRALELVTTIQRQLPVYTGLVETARTNNRAGNPVSVAYMAEASSLMREEILPAASELFILTSGQVREQQNHLTAPQWVPLSGLLAAVVFLLLAQWWLWRLTRRRLNKGFLAATALLVTAIIWVSVSNFGTWQAGTRGFEEASMPWDSLTASRIQAQQARTTETLSLVRRESVDESQASFADTIDGVTAALDDYEAAEGHNPLATSGNSRLVNEARTALINWEDAHARFAEALRTGDFQEAVRLSTTTTVAPGSPPTAAGAYDTLDAALSRLIADARSSMRAFINDGLAATQLVSTAVLVLSLAAVVAVWLGVRPRLQEYL
ncbi:hypothetical protein [Corynebacterium halotolerans]|uniref:Phenol hydroxylase n=1 Tax=Corynebacterium halotolerans YIM 70093 = DSM 44683 TaxID=1121362 RepID=M1P146_9CORY|nr:hypothetical protein [Corynebacterium halotolerans]AGF73495.1 hypothetical protein A605_12495 [Corynebacterium halotolerans YIM 70093 = DSM 44683]